MDDVPDRRAFDLGPPASWAWLTAGVTLLGAAEVIGIAALVHAVLPASTGCLVDAVIAVPTVVLLMAVASALTGRITVDPEQFRLRFGLLGGAVVPRSQISRAERFVPSTINPIGLGLSVPHGSRQVTVTLGGRAVFVRILLDRPVLVRTALFRRAGADEFVIATSSPEALIAALAPADQPTDQPADQEVDQAVE
jgi:hypothetical protein